MDVDAWDNLPWWQQQLYVDGFIEEGLLTFEGQEGGPPDEPPPRSRPSKDDIDVVTASAGDLESLGLKVIQGGRV